MKNRKAQETIGSLPSSIIAIVVAIIILVLGVVIIQEIRDVPMVSTNEAYSTTNETLTTVAEAGELVACGTYPAGVCNVEIVTNATAGNTIPSSNYTITNCNIAYSGESGGQGHNNSDWNVTYSCTYGGVGYTASNASLVAVGNFSDFIPIIIIALAASIVIGLILLGFLARGRQR